MFWQASRRRIRVEKEVERQLGCFVEVGRCWGWRALALGGGAGTLVEDLSRTSIMFLYNRFVVSKEQRLAVEVVEVVIFLG